MGHVGQNIRREREVQDYPQSLLAFEVGLSQPQLSKIENGRKRITRKCLSKVAETLHVPIERLEDESMPASHTAPAQPLMQQTVILTGLNELLEQETNKEVINKTRLRSIVTVMRLLIEHRGSRKP